MLPPGQHSAAPLNSRPGLRDYLPLLWRLAVIAGVAAAETMLRLATAPYSPFVVATFPYQKYVYSFLIAWAAIVAMLAIVGSFQRTREASALLAGTRPSISWFVAHVVLIGPLLLPSLLQLVVDPGPAAELLQHLLAVLAMAALLFALLPPRVLRALLHKPAGLLLLAALLALAAVLMMHGSQTLWTRATAITFSLVRLLLTPFYPQLSADPATRVLGTDTIEVFVDEMCSGLEGVGLMIVFLAGWLWYLRREFRFPAALLLIPTAALAVFLLNSVRIAVLFAIAAHGHAKVAMVGFHSQAGWIFFNATAFLVAIVSRRIQWLQRERHASSTVTSAPTSDHLSAYLLPLLAVLATGMLTRAVSGDLNMFYWLRLVVAAAVLIAYRKAYKSLDWRFGWLGIIGGVLIFAVWLFAANWLSAPAGPPEALLSLSDAQRVFWITTRVLVAVLAVPIVEELAFRGFLMRRLQNADFEAVRFQAVRWTPLLVSSLLFGLSHGSYWAPGILAGIVFGWVAIRSGRFGDAVIAHALANALLAATVLAFDQWQLW